VLEKDGKDYSRAFSTADAGGGGGGGGRGGGPGGKKRRI
jgi:hypothetical protein